MSLRNGGTLKGARTLAILSNPRHERFAQALAAGRTADEAYVLAGYKANRGNAATLKAKQNIAIRVAELQAAAAAQTMVTIQTIADMLQADRLLAHELKQSGAAVRASESLGKLFGLYADRSLNQNVNTNFVIGAEAVSREERLRRHGDDGDDGRGK